MLRLANLVQKAKDEKQHISELADAEELAERAKEEAEARVQHALELAEKQDATGEEIDQAREAAELAHASAMAAQNRLTLARKSRAQRLQELPFADAGEVMGSTSRTSHTSQDLSEAAARITRLRRTMPRAEASDD
eukprot:TRINITY_DN17195_c0_g1_i2.p2 TRINITY_DN17195_c0_g1~~TRINITY_DN17195_c0_g1_i2.p2  ORF type:complete len:136 (+),score=32.42 TRINITY_DN17195_c0_g1_i2:860-1267(+)